MDNLNYIDIVKSRIKYLEELAKTLPISKSFNAQVRLEEAKAILKMFESLKE